MKFILKLRFHTNVGQSLWLTGNHPLLGDGQPDRALPLQYLNDEFWQGSLHLPDDEALRTEVAYNYILRDPGGTFIYDWGRDKKIGPSSRSAREVLIVDSWNDASYIENAFYTEPFQEILLRANRADISIPARGSTTHTFRAKAPLLTKGQTLCLLGNSGILSS